jgi:succinate dehydrogenase/fumarate reductase flavoprotein subunit
MKAALMFVVVGIGAVTCAVVFGQSGPEQAKQPLAPTPAHSNAAPNYIIQELAPGGPNFFAPNLQDQSGQLVQEYVKAEKEEDKKEIRKKLADVLGKQFDAHMKQQQEELAALERQISELKAIMKKRQDAKTTIIDRRMDQLIQDAEGLGWTAPGSPHQPRAVWQQPSPYYRSSSAVGRPYGETKAEAKRP